MQRESSGLEEKKHNEAAKCVACFEETSNDLCSSGHPMCMNCWDSYIKFQMENKAYMIRLRGTVRCPGGCDEMIPLEKYGNYLGKDTLFELSKLAFGALDNASDLKLGETLSWAEQVALRVRVCPGCGIVITRIAGCSHMTCSCLTEFHWNCGRPYNECWGGAECNGNPDFEGGDESDLEHGDEYGYDEDDYDEYNYYHQGIGYDREGYDREGYDREGYDPDGYDRDGNNRDGNDAMVHHRDDPRPVLPPPSPAPVVGRGFVAALDASMGGSSVGIGTAVEGIQNREVWGVISVDLGRNHWGLIRPGEDRYMPGTPYSTVRKDNEGVNWQVHVPNSD